MAVVAGTRVQVRLRLLEPGGRAPGLPKDTAALPYLAWIRGTLEHDADRGALVTIRTAAGRRVQGVLDVVEPADTHTFGRPAKPWVEMVARIGDLRRERT